MKNIIITTDPYLIMYLFLMPLSLIILVFFIFYNRKYMIKNQDSFIVTIFGENGLDKIKGMNSELILLGNILKICINIDFLIGFFSKKTLFPNRNDKSKPLKILPNTYKENVNFFKVKHCKWIIFNNIIDFTILVVFISFIIYSSCFI
jgi:hypothetical protein